MTRLKGFEAIEYAEQHELPLCKYRDPTEDARQDLTIEQARKIALEDPSLIYLEASGHAHTCLDCGAVIAVGDFDCELDKDHDFALCDTCAAQKEME